MFLKLTYWLLIIFFFFIYCSQIVRTAPIKEDGIGFERGTLSDKEIRMKQHRMIRTSNGIIEKYGKRYFKVKYGSNEYFGYYKKIIKAKTDGCIHRYIVFDHEYKQYQPFYRSMEMYVVNYSDIDHLFYVLDKNNFLTNLVILGDVKKIKKEARYLKKQNPKWKITNTEEDSQFTFKGTVTNEISVLVTAAVKALKIACKE